MLVATYYTDARYKALADRMLESAKAVGLDGIGYEVANPSGDWKTGDGMKPAVVLRAVREHPNDSILFVDADCYFHQYPKLLDEASHDYEMAAYYDTPKMVYSTVTWFRAGKGEQYAARWLEEWKKMPEKPNDVGALVSAIENTLPRRVLHLPVSYCWCPELDRHRFGPIRPVIEHFAVGEHSFGGNNYRKTKNSIY